MNASRLGAIAAEFTDTETTSLQSGGELSLSGNVGAAKANAKASGSSTRTQESQVVRRSIVQTTFRELYEHEKDRLATRAVPDDVEIPQIDTLDELIEAEEVLKTDGLIVDPKRLARGALLEMEVELDTESIFQFSTLLQTLVEIIQENTDLFGMDEEAFEKEMAYGRIIERLLAGLVPIRGLAVDYVRIKPGQREWLAHRKLSERLLAGGLAGDQQLETTPLYVVGVTEEALYWKDIRRVFGKDDSGGEETDDGRRLALRGALNGYATSLATAYGRELNPDDLLSLQGVVERHQDSFRTTSAMKAGFDAIAQCLADSFGIELHASAEKERRLKALADAGLSLAGELEPPTEPSDDASLRPAREEYVLDSEFIAIYW